jgi:ABC-2 type transport system permease protein
MSTVDLGAQRIVRPSALSGGWQRFMHLSVALATTELKIRFFDSVLGYLWSLARPLMFFGVLYAVFSQIVPAGEGVAHYPVMLLVGVVLYTFLSEATVSGVESLVTREPLLRKVQFPRLAIPTSVVLVATFDLAMNLVATLGLGLATGVTPRWSWLELPLLLALLLLWASGLAMLLSVLFLRFRDVKPIWGVLIQMLFYLTPILYPIELIAEKNETLARIALCNPLATINQQVRHAVIDPQAPSAAEAIGPDVLLLVPGMLVVLSITLGLIVFSRRAPRLSEEL